MEIGEKIRSVRISKKMTQAELAGDQITRNMLSLIENGSALPSLQTVVYLAERLEVPVGQLLAKESEESIYLKMSRLPKIHAALKRKDYRLCADMCLGLIEMSLESHDDEILMILAESHFGIAVEEFNFGKLHNACRELDEACEYSKRTLYDCGYIRGSAARYFEYMRRLSPTLTSEYENEAYNRGAFVFDEFCKYLLVLDELEKGSDSLAEAYLESITPTESGYAAHIRAMLEIRSSNYAEARRILEKLIGGDELICRAVTYRIFADLENCCRELGDYKSAYEYSVGKVELLEYMLKE